MNESFENLFESAEAKIQDAANQFVVFHFFTDFEEAKRRIVETEFKTLEEYTGKTTEELENVKSGICQSYNALVQDIQNPDLTKETLEDLVRKITNLVHV